MLEKIQLIVLGLSASPANNNAYALLLQELEGTRRLPIIIGAFEAQAIAIELEGVNPPRPMTHDIMKEMLEFFGASVTEVFIHELREGTFYAKIIMEDFGFEIDARPSDAIALAVRCNAPIFIDSDVFQETAIESSESAQYMREDNGQFLRNKRDGMTNNKIEQLKNMLTKAINDEDYERAAKLRDELKNLEV